METLITSFDVSDGVGLTPAQIVEKFIATYRFVFAELEKNGIFIDVKYNPVTKILELRENEDIFQENHRGIAIALFEAAKTK